MKPKKKTYIHPTQMRTAQCGMRGTANGLWIAWDVMPTGAYHESDAEPHQRAAYLHRLACHAMVDCGFWPAWIVIAGAALIGIGACASVMGLITLITR